MPPDGFRFGLTGWPVEHSLSPSLHQAALAALGLPGSYKLFPVPPSTPPNKGLADLVSWLRHGQLHGMNVTLPYKTTILPFVDRRTESVTQIGAANTLFLQDDQVVADNTDAPGLMADLRTHFPFLFPEVPLKKDKRQVALVLGAGGAARAAVYALLQAGWQVIVAARRPEQVASLVQSFPNSQSHLASIQLEAASLQKILATNQIKLLLNATSVGMTPRISESPWPQEVALPDCAAVYDLVYTPQETALVRQARSAGIPAYGGGGMLVEQAALSLERWIGIVPPRNVMLAALEKELNYL